MPKRYKIAVAFAAVYIIWGSTYLGIRIAIETLPPLLMAGFRYLVAGMLLYPWAMRRSRERPLALHWRSTIVIGALLLLGGNGAVSWSEQRVPTGLAALMISTVPLWMALLQWVRPGGARPSGQVIAGVAMGLLGLLLLVGPSRVIGGPRPDPVGATVLLLGALSWSIGSLYSRRAKLPKEPLLGIAMEMICGGGLLILGGLTLGEGGRLDLAAVSSRSVLALLYLIFFGSLVGFTCYVWLLRVSTPAKVSTYAFVNPVVAVLLGWWLGREEITPRILISAAVIVAAVAIITVSRPPRQAS